MEIDDYIEISWIINKMTITSESLRLIKLKNPKELSLSYFRMNNISYDQHRVYLIYLKYLNCTNCTSL